MTRRERLMATLRGEPVDRPAVSFYEINGLDEDPDDQDLFNIYRDPSWLPLINLARDKTDRMVLRQIRQKIHGSDDWRAKAAQMVGIPYNPLEYYSETETWIDRHGHRLTRNTVRIGAKHLSSLTRQDPDVNTVWTTEPLLKNVADLRLLLSLPVTEFTGEPDISDVIDTETKLGETGIVVIDTPDPLCLAAELFDLATYTMVAMTEQNLFHQLLERFAIYLHGKTAAVSRYLPGRLWRVYGPEFASHPFLPANLFREYVVQYDKPMVEIIQKDGGFCRLHSHGNLRNILDDIVSMGCMGLDPVEPPPQGDVTLSYVRNNYGRELVLFGNLEASDIENLSADEMKERVIKAIEEGTAGTGKGFVLMPSSCPYGRKLSARAMQNYETIIGIVEELN